MAIGIDELAEGVGQALKLAPDLYADALKPSAQESGKLLGRIPRIINAVLVPLDIWVMNKEYNIEETKKLLAKKLENVSPEKIVPPDAYVAVPALQAIAYSMKSEELRNMYANVLAKSMNADEKDNVHPSFVEIIKQLSPFDAKLLENFRKIQQIRNESHPIMKLRSQISEQETTGFDRINHILSPSLGISINNYQQYSISIDNLIRLYLIKVEYTTFLTDKTYYNDIVNSDLVQKLKVPLSLEQAYPYVRLQEGLLKITDLGQSFIDICIS